MKLKCIIIDDEPDNIALLKEYIGQVSFLECSGSYTDPVEAMIVLNSNKTDLLFTDIEMPGLSGLSLVRLIQYSLQVIFITAHRNYALDGFELNAVDYLLKPITFERFLKAANKAYVNYTHQYSKNAVSNENNRFTDSVFVPKDGRLIKINTENILYIKSSREYITIVTKEHKTEIRMRLKEIIEKLPEKKIIRVNKSYLVNIDEITAVYSNCIEISNGEQVTIPKALRKTLEQRISS